MSTFYTGVVKCALCGTESAQKMLASTSSIASELDGRPIGMHRSTMECWTQIYSNPDCGYCTYQISKEVENARECIKSTDYRLHLTDPSLRELIRKFYCAALIHLWAKQPDESFNYFRAASWVCDDAGLPSDARAFRILCTRLPYSGNPVVPVDILRRAGEFAQAKLAHDRALAIADIDEFTRNMLDLELFLINSKDAGVHTTEEIKPVLQPSPSELGSCTSTPGSSNPKSFKVGESGLGEEFKSLPEDIEDALCEGPELPQ